MPKRVTDEQWTRYAELTRSGLTRTQAAREVGITPQTAKKFDEGTSRTGRKIRELNADVLGPDVVPLNKLRPAAKKALEDFGYFRRRYFGRIASPWQEAAAEQCKTYLETPDKEFVVVNCPPGGGKSTLFTHDIPIWLLVQNRALRFIIGSATQKQAKQYTGRIRRSLERHLPLSANAEEKAKGRAVDAEATLTADFGRFRPMAQDLWRIEEFVVAQHDAQLIEDKEPSFAAFGMDSGFLGHRANFVIWDDLVDQKNQRNSEAREQQQQWWATEAETRLEPGGLLILQGQRIAAEDLYRHCLDMTTMDENDEPSGKKYHHILYKAHDEARCDNLHKTTDPAWPQGCLLDPIRIPWRELRALMANSNERYRVLYQQEDIDPANVLVNPMWVKGGRDPDSGEEYPGCWDLGRGLCELPHGLSGQVLSVATADPSPTKFWSIQWWAYHPDTQQRFLLDLVRQTMDAPSFLDWDSNNGQFRGLMHQWQERSSDLGLPITHWIVEENAAQRFMLQYDHVKKWQAKQGVVIIGHQTHRNKSDAEYGVQTIGPHWRFGRVRLPGKQDGYSRIAAQKLVDEVTRYPEGRTDDCVMAEWFFEWNLPRIYSPPIDLPKRRRPSWLRRAA